MFWNIWSSFKRKEVKEKLIVAINDRSHNFNGCRGIVTKIDTRDEDRTYITMFIKKYEVECVLRRKQVVSINTTAKRILGGRNW